MISLVAVEMQVRPLPFVKRLHEFCLSTQRVLTVFAFKNLVAGFRLSRTVNAKLESVTIHSGLPF